MAPISINRDHVVTFHMFLLSNNFICSFVLIHSQCFRKKIHKQTDFSNVTCFVCTMKLAWKIYFNYCYRYYTFHWFWSTTQSMAEARHTAEVWERGLSCSIHQFNDIGLTMSWCLFRKTSASAIFVAIDAIDNMSHPLPRNE